MKLKRFIQKAIRFLTKPRYITLGFGSEDEEIAEDLNNRIFEIQTNNFRNIMQKLIKFERDYELANSGLLFSDEQLRERALQRFYIAKKDGRLDELNNIIRQDEEIKK